MTEYTVFIDRDGVINHDSDAYIKHPDEFHFISKSPEAVALLSAGGFQVILITNQSAVGRGMISESTLDAILKKMILGVEQAGGRIKDIFFCPHTPDQGCDCRKPEPGMILQAMKRHNIDLKKAFMIGDSAKDIECGKNAGCAQTILVKTGNGKKALVALTEKGIAPDFIAKDLYEAACWITANFPFDNTDS
ncbi:D-glycero-beta-D-manno-heptose 1,7-bisphosphate 7-phosphatase [uncultured Desulfobacter sp.]|uniref:D-glycero-beta-D-manno-heptose 1,7-bisphosphate 7-phosphatase n=1 Tax=uncultured Desulfobacter sp. TaxID=240139 RepID=UPI0029F4DF1D|nr:D-glycero-beta-D-manno-heptose 1,7-bisphosphate 7-phosphatase [uncultured Desulfobacter sp.]